MLNEGQITEALKAVKYPGYSRDIVSFGLVKEISVNNGAVSVLLQLTGGTPEVVPQLKSSVEQALRALPGVTNVMVQVKQQSAAPSSGIHPNKLPGIKRVVAVASGKGGVGKSTASVNLACGLSYLGASV